MAWLHVQTYAAGHRTTYAFQDVLTGDAKKGEAYFNATGTCTTCHSATGDLKGIGSRYDAFSLQARWLQPRGGAARRTRRRGGVAPTQRDHRDGDAGHRAQPISGTLDRVDDFSVSLRDAAGEYHSFTRDGDVPKVEIHDPLKAHTRTARQVHRRRHPQHDCLPGDPEMKIRAFCLFAACCRCRSLFAQGLDPGRLCSSSRPTPGRLTTAIIPAGASVR